MSEKNLGRVPLHPLDGGNTSANPSFSGKQNTYAGVPLALSTTRNV